MPHKDKEERREYKKKYNKKYRLEHIEEKEERREYNKKYYLQHKDRISTTTKEYRLEHKGERKPYQKKWYSEHKEEKRATNRKWRKNKHDNDPIYKRVHNIKSIFKYILLKIITNGNITDRNDSQCLKYFGTTVDGFKKHIESQFTDTMSWYNHGQIYNPDAWQLDHIIRIGSFDFTIEENFTKAFHYTNTQPLMSSDHLEKSNKEKGEKYDK